MKPRPLRSAKAHRKATKAKVQTTPHDPPQSTSQLLRVQHELRVYQIELEMQNEELRNARAEIEAGLERYTDLYDFAPSGYFNLNDRGLIRLVNLAGAHLAGQSRADLTGQRFSALLSPPRREAFANILKSVFTSSETQSFESILLPHGQPPRLVHLAASRSPDARECRLVAVDITEARQARQTLDLRERALAEVSQGVVIANEQRLIIYANASFTKLTGYPPEEILGRKCSFIQGPETSQATILKIRAALDTGLGFEEEILNYRKDGTPFWNELTISPILDPTGGPIRFVGILRDVTERKKTIALLADSQRRLALATESAHIGIWEWDVSRDAMICNDQMFLLHGLDQPGDASSHGAWLKTIHPGDRPRFQAEASAALKGNKDFQSQFRIILLDGRIRHLRTYGTVRRRKEGIPIQMIGVSWDVTEECEHEEKIAAALVHEKRLAKEARAGECAKREFLAVMSHEIRTPVNGILGFAELLAQSEGLPTELHNYSRIIAQSSASLLRILDDILDFSRIEAGHIQVETTTFSPRKLLQDISNLFFPQISGKGINLIVTVAVDVPEYLAADAGRLRQILLNLVGNAVKFTHEGQITIRLARSPGSSAVFIFSVEDTGPGIPAEHLKKIFSPFTQADSSISRRHGGTGLGLTISRRLTELLGGTLTVTSRPGQGAKFAVTIPLAIATAPFAPASAGPVVTLDATFAALHPMKILIVEDDPVNLKLISILVRRLGYEPLCSKNGKAAVQITRRHHPDCILMDLQMPEMDGLDATRAIRSRKTASPIFITALTANIFPSDRQSCIDAGMDDYLNKPLKLDALANVFVKASMVNGGLSPAGFARENRPARTVPQKV